MSNAASGDICRSTSIGLNDKNWARGDEHCSLGGTQYQDTLPTWLLSCAGDSTIMSLNLYYIYFSTVHDYYSYALYYSITKI